MFFSGSTRAFHSDVGLGLAIADSLMASCVIVMAGQAEIGWGKVRITSEKPPGSSAADMMEQGRGDDASVRG